MRTYALDIPFLGTVDIELNGITKPRNGRPIDASRGPGCVELWVGSRGQFYILLERYRKRPSFGSTTTS
ncbi:hypothetical protein FG93_03505 [Bosea sp. LC85]|nr:hypothetical protein FG93_03505 [Bosea sp. LC85]